LNNSGSSYLEDINEKKCITILRQFLKYIDYNLKMKEKYINGVKNYRYFIICNKKKIREKATPMKEK
jgi:hypothetical protein